MKTIVAVLVACAALWLIDQSMFNGRYGYAVQRMFSQLLLHAPR